ncbi:hypothetical protein HN682_07440 [Candidatus Peregrinibacteria bacterium]|nr:hypothetical protein [Candidatus Peregrinibacteria bacterium]
MRISIKDLERKIDYLNEITVNNVEPWSRKESGLTANVGNYHLSGAYGGWELHQMYNTGGAVTDVLGSGYLPKKELYYRICSFINGIEL